jgi:hypothetical protein
MNESTTENTKPARKIARAQLTKMQLECISDALSNAPAPPQAMTQKTALIELAPSLKAAAKRGHNAASIAAILEQQGMHVSERAVARAMRSGQPKNRLNGAI